MSSLKKDFNYILNYNSIPYLLKEEQYTFLLPQKIVRYWTFTCVPEEYLPCLDAINNACNPYYDYYKVYQLRRGY